MNQLRALLNDSEHEEMTERLANMLELLNALEEIIPATPGSRSHIEHQLHRLMADMIAARTGTARIPTSGVVSMLYH